MDMANLNSLKVADLKQLLKARGLSVVGVKSELIQRLESAMLNNLLPNTGVISAVGVKSIEKEIDEEAILAGDDDGSFCKTDDTLIHNEDLLLSESHIVTSNIVSKTNTAVGAPVQQKLPTMVESSSVKAKQPQTGPIKANPAIATSTTTTPKVQAISKANLTPEQLKELRQQKFADPKLKNRQERFGTVGFGKTPLIDSDKLKRRVERFGETVSPVAKIIDEKERILKRQERFGSVNATNGSKVTSNLNASNEIKKRQDRFGVVENPKPIQNSILPGFKRRRFAF